MFKQIKLIHSTTSLTNNRFTWIDYDRGISIILVTYRHCFESLSNTNIQLHHYPFFEYVNVFLFGFRMPLFFIASGIFISSSIKKYGLPIYIKQRAQTILYPLMVWGIIQISLQLIFIKQINTIVTLNNYLDLIINPRETAQFWYLNALFFVGILYAFNKVVFKFKVAHQIVLGFILYLLLAYLRTQHLYLGFIMDILQYYLFFAVGDAVSTFMLQDKSAKLFSSQLLLFILVPIFCIVQYFFTKINLLHQSNYYVEHHLPFFFLLVAFIGCSLSINISYLLKKNNRLPILKSVGFHSVHIYCMQIIAMSAARFIFLNGFGITYPPVLIFLVLILGITLPILFYNICIRLNFWWLFSLKKPNNQLSNINLTTSIINK